MIPLRDSFLSLVEAANAAEIDSAVVSVTDIQNAARNLIKKIRLLLQSEFRETEIIDLHAGLTTEIGSICNFPTECYLASIKEAAYQIATDTGGKIIRPLELAGAVESFYDKGYDSGLRIAEWPLFTEHLKIAKKELTIITGIPGHGKSEFVDDLMVRLARHHKIKTAYFSPENYPHEIHMEKLLSKVLNKPFHAGIHPRMTKAEMSEKINSMNSYFSFIVPSENNISLDAILSITEKEIKEKNINALIIDPWNEIDGNRDKGETETDYIGRALMKCRRFARNHNIIFFIVAHPMKLQKDKEGRRPVPTPYDISGSSHWFNKADNCLCVFREIDRVDVYIQKVKFKLHGKVGQCSFRYDIPTGRYTELAIDKNNLPENF